ncbi:MAG: NAD(+)/NADH kinase [Candidatus Bathyarchaeota archaeon]|nr:NAD(+)/NADH kinase [Candidatus Bathyarchaeota archaeon]
MFKTAGIVARYDKKQAIILAEKISKYLEKKGLEVFIEDTLAEKMNEPKRIIQLENMKTDFIVTIGGDGTILRAGISIPKPEPPILAINMGVRGFLTEVEPKDAFLALDKCLKGEYKIEKSNKLSISVGNKHLPDALNDVVISTGEPSKIIYTQIFKNSKPILKCQTDGLILATQTGSTGYSLSAGGPVLDKEIDAFVLTPICSLTVFHSLVFSAKSKVSIKLIRPKKMVILIDGNYKHIITSEDPKLSVSYSKNNTSFIRFEDDFYHRLRSRLLFKGMG